VIVRSGIAPASVVFEIPWDGLSNSYVFYVCIPDQNISEGPSMQLRFHLPIPDSSTIAANLSEAVIGNPTWPLINDIESIFSLASYYRNWYHH
jgi:hypothetical protein